MSRRAEVSNEAADVTEPMLKTQIEREKEAWAEPGEALHPQIGATRSK